MHAKMRTQANNMSQPWKLEPLAYNHCLYADPAIALRAIFIAAPDVSCEPQTSWA